MGSVKRCEWAQSPLMIEYHDTEWGVPVHDDRLLFEFLILEGAQAGLSWDTSLKKRAATPESIALSRDLVRRGFKFVGPTICYAFMQAVGLVNDHEVDCFRHAQVATESAPESCSWASSA